MSVRTHHTNIPDTLLVLSFLLIFVWVSCLAFVAFCGSALLANTGTLPSLPLCRPIGNLGDITLRALRVLREALRRWFSSGGILRDG